MVNYVQCVTFEMKTILTPNSYVQGLTAASHLGDPLQPKCHKYTSYHLEQNPLKTLPTKDIAQGHDVSGMAS